MEREQISNGPGKIDEKLKTKDLTAEESSVDFQNSGPRAGSPRLSTAHEC